jgi:hypothetical protein
VGALGHFLEAEGVPTTQISLIREHTEVIKPPRALWVPFELGRPLGRPSDTVLQRRVLVAALDLFKARLGPVLEDFSHEGTNYTALNDPEPAVWACPVSFTAPAKAMSDNEKLIDRFKQEVAELRNWYDVGLNQTDRTSVVNFDPDSASQLLSAYVLNGSTNSTKTDLPFAVALRLAAQDLKAFYFEAMIARPAMAPPGSKTFNRWFWSEMVAGQVLKAVKERCLNEPDKSLRLTGAMLLVPLDQG